MSDFAKKNPSNYKNDATQELLGRSIITNYNNRTYKVVFEAYFLYISDILLLQLLTLA
jgi:hypothetical protein